MATIFSKMSKNQKTVTVIIIVIGILSLTIFSYYSVGLPTAIIGIVAMIVTVTFLMIDQYKSKYRRKTKNLPRRGWTEQEKEIVRNRQDGRCNKCEKVPPRWHYDHIDGDRSNNSLRNCQGLCPNCHDVKTHDED